MPMWLWIAAIFAAEVLGLAVLAMPQPATRRIEPGLAPRRRRSTANTGTPRS